MNRGGKEQRRTGGMRGGEERVEKENWVSVQDGCSTFELEMEMGDFLTLFFPGPFTPANSRNPLLHCNLFS